LLKGHLTCGSRWRPQMKQGARLELKSDKIRVQFPVRVFDDPPSISDSKLDEQTL
jgi:hypothetical protein